MNRYICIGRITKDAELKYAQSTQTEMCNFTVVVDREMNKEQREQAKANNKQTWDFIDCVAFKQSAKYLSMYAKKGDTVSVEGKLQKNEYYDNSGNKKYIVQVLVDNVKIIKKNESTQGNATQYNVQNEIPYDESEGDDLPF